jgi:hypothetical protein
MRRVAPAAAASNTEADGLMPGDRPRSRSVFGPSVLALVACGVPGTISFARARKRSRAPPRTSAQLISVTFGSVEVATATACSAANCHRI